MAYYRLYHISDGHFNRVEELSAEDDLQAIRQADALVETGGAELWCGRRRVKTFAPDRALGARRSDLTEPAQDWR